jgi:hypothetical protein
MTKFCTRISSSCEINFELVLEKEDKKHCIIMYSTDLSFKKLPVPLSPIEVHRTAK